MQDFATTAEQPAFANCCLSLRSTASGSGRDSVRPELQRAANELAVQVPGRAQVIPQIEEHLASDPEYLGTGSNLSHPSRRPWGLVQPKGWERLTLLRADPMAWSSYPAKAGLCLSRRAILPMRIRPRLTAARKWPSSGADAFRLS